MNRDEIFVDPLQIKPIGVIRTELIKTYAEQLSPMFGMTPEEVILWFAFPVFSGAVLKPFLEKKKIAGQLSPAALKIEDEKQKWQQMYKDTIDMLEKITIPLNLGSYI